MINGMYLSTMGGMVQMARHGAIANNLANSNTGGFKPDWTVMRAVDTESVYHGSMRPEIDQILERTGGGVWLDRTYSNFATGTVRETGNPLDLALRDEEGYKSFFQVEKNGQLRYTRNGSFQIRADGNLVTNTGALVLDSSSQPIIIPEGARPEIDQQGTVTDAANGNVAIAQIGVFRTATPNELVKEGDNLFVASDQAGLEPSQLGVLSRKLEDSGADPIREMVAMIEASRTYETNMKFLSIQDEALGESVRRINGTA